VYDVTNDRCWAGVGIDHDTAPFAVAPIRGWREHLGRKRYPYASTLETTADTDGSNGYRPRPWECELQRLADETGAEIQVCHFARATSKRNKIEHRLFSLLTRTWRAKLLLALEVISNLIAAATSRTGREVHAQPDRQAYPDKIKVSDQQIAVVQGHGGEFRPDWNYRIKPPT